MRSYYSSDELLLNRLIAGWSGDVVALVLVVVVALLFRATRLARWSYSSSLLVLSVGLATIARTCWVSEYAAVVLLAARCAEFVTLKYVVVAPVRWLKWVALGALTASGWASAREARSRAPGAGRGGILLRWLVRALVALAALTVLAELEELCEGKPSDLRHRYYYGLEPYERCYESRQPTTGR